MSDGRLLKPIRPIMSLESSFLRRAFQSTGPSGQLWAAYTEVCTYQFIFYTFNLLKFSLVVPNKLFRTEHGTVSVLSDNKKQV